VFDILTWDCKSRVDVGEHRLRCTHERATVMFSGMQTYKASRNLAWKDEFRGGPLRDVFSGGDKDDIMSGRGGADRLIGGTGHDAADGGPGQDSCRAEQQRRC
jgi:hypothetical protein